MEEWKTKSRGERERERERERRHGMSRVLSRSCRGIQTWLSPTSLQYPLWHFLWCEWGRIHSHPTQVVYCFCLRRLTQRPRLRTRLASLCRRPVLAGDSCHANGKTLGRQLKQDTSFGIFFFGWRFLCVFFFFPRRALDSFFSVCVCFFIFFYFFFTFLDFFFVLRFSRSLILFWSWSLLKSARKRHSASEDSRPREKVLVGLSVLVYLFFFCFSR